MWKPSDPFKPPPVKPPPEKPGNPIVKSGKKKRVTPLLTDDPGKSQVIYNSDLIIRNPSEAATLCVFYDRVFLPFTNAGRSGGLIDTRSKASERDVLYGSTDEIKDWELSYGTLFDEGVLARVPPEDERSKADYFPEEEQIVKIWEFHKAKREEGEQLGEQYFDWPLLADGDWLDAFGKLITNPSEQIKDGDVVIYEGYEECSRREGEYLVGYYAPYTEVVRLGRNRPPWRDTKTITLNINPSSLPYLNVERRGASNLVRLDLMKHLLRQDITLPQIYSNPRGTGLARQALVALEAQAAFSYLLPKVQVQHPTQILELREKVKDTREGFAMHLLKLSKGLEEHANEGALLSEVAKYANNLIETELIPDYREFQRQLESIRAGTWKNFLDAAGKIAEIDAAPWTPKFWALLLKALGIAIIETEEEQKEKLSNRYQAFKFMGEIEKGGRQGL